MTKSSKRWSGLSYGSCTAYQQYLNRRDLAESAQCFPLTRTTTDTRLTIV